MSEAPLHTKNRSGKIILEIGATQGALAGLTDEIHAYYRSLRRRGIKNAPASEFTWLARHTEAHARCCRSSAEQLQTLADEMRAEARKRGANR